MRADYPILEFDPSPRSVIEPRRPRRLLEPAPDACVLTFFGEVIRKLLREKRLRRLVTFRSEMGPFHLYDMAVGERRVAVFPAAVGAPLAAGLLDEIIPCGCRYFVACGGAGVLNREIAVGHVVVPVSAVRDEGTSYHYLPPSREVDACPAAIDAIERTLIEQDVPYVKGKTWTTDAFYRETPARVALRRAEGCLTVEMEAAAFFAVAQFRGVQFGQMLYGGDDVSGDEWDARNWNRRRTARGALFWLAVDAALRLADGA